MAKEWKRGADQGWKVPILFSWTEPSGEVKGFDIDIANALCEEMNLGEAHPGQAGLGR